MRYASEMTARWDGWFSEIRRHSPSQANSLQNPVRWCVVGSVAVLICMGLLSLDSASMWRGEDWYQKQLVWTACGILAAIAAGVAGYRPLARFQVPWVLYGAVAVLLVLVLMPGLGSKVNGARRWLWGLQPSEAAKPIMIIALAAYCSPRLEAMRDLVQGFIKPALLVLPLLALVFIEPDWGTAILLAAVAGVMLAVAGAPWKWLLVGGFLGLVVVAVALLTDPVRQARFIGFMDPERWKNSHAWQPWLQILSIGRGHWFGTGWGEGLLKLGFVPEQHTDGILSLIGEETGLLGTTLVLGAFGALFLSGLWISWRAPDPFSQLLATGITFLIALQALMNVGVAVSVLPNKGIALPFISYGGSCQVTMLACVGLLLGIDARSGRAPGSSGAKGSCNNNFRLNGGVSTISGRALPSLGVA